MAGDCYIWISFTTLLSPSVDRVLTAHVYLANGLPGPFANLNELKYGDQIIIHAYGQRDIWCVVPRTGLALHL